MIRIQRAETRGNLRTVIGQFFPAGICSRMPKTKQAELQWEAWHKAWLVWSNVFVFKLGLLLVFKMTKTAGNSLKDPEEQLSGEKLVRIPHFVVNKDVFVFVIYTRSSSTAVNIALMAKSGFHSRYKPNKRPDKTRTTVKHC